MPFVMIPDIPLGFSDHYLVLSNDFHRNNNKVFKMSLEDGNALQKAHLCACAGLWGFFLFTLFPLYQLII